jgi:hypothetical protein
MSQFFDNKGSDIKPNLKINIIGIDLAVTAPERGVF